MERLADELQIENPLHLEEKELRAAAISRETIDAIRGIQRGLDEMKAGKGKPFRQVFDEIRAKYNIPRRKSSRGGR